MNLVHWPLIMGRLLRLVQREGAWAGPLYVFICHQHHFRHQFCENCPLFGLPVQLAILGRTVHPFSSYSFFILFQLLFDVFAFVYCCV